MIQQSYKISVFKFLRENQSINETFLKVRTVYIEVFIQTRSFFRDQLFKVRFFPILVSKPIRKTFLKGLSFLHHRLQHLLCAFCCCFLMPICEIILQISVIQRISSNLQDRFVLGFNRKHIKNHCFSRKYIKIFFVIPRVFLNHHQRKVTKFLDVSLLSQDF